MTSIIPVEKYNPIPFNAPTISLEDVPKRFKKEIKTTTIKLILKKLYTYYTFYQNL